MTTRKNGEIAQAVAELHGASADEFADQFDKMDGFNAALDSLPGDAVPQGVNAERWLAGYREGMLTRTGA